MKARHTITIIAILLSTVITADAQKPLKRLSQLRDGDLLFQTSTEGNAITDVTQGHAGYAIDHVGIFHIHDGQPMVLEASYDGVTEVAYETYISQSPVTLAGRVKGPVDIAVTLSKAHQYIGKHYDFLYLPDNDDIYCSELIQLSYTDKHRLDIFSPIPMTFRDASGQVSAWWADYYSRRMHEVPEGLAGSNPGELSRNPRVKIKYIIR